MIFLFSRMSTLSRHYLSPFVSAVLIISTSAAVTFGAEVKMHPIVPQIAAINRGDTITWTIPTPFTLPENFVLESYTGEWHGILSNVPNASFSFKFDQPGTYAYRFYRESSEATNAIYAVRSGLITVLDWTNQPPPITINSPVDGYSFSRSFNLSTELIVIRASVADHVTDFRHVEFYSGTTCWER